MSDQSPLSVSIVCPTSGERNNWIEIVASIEYAGFEDWELIIVNQGPTSDGLRNIAAHPRVRVVRCRKGAARARNRGVRAAAASFEYVLCIDDDIVLTSGALEALQFAIDMEADAVAGTIESGEHGGKQRVEFGLKPNRLAKRSVWSSAMEGLMLYRRITFLEFGGMQDSLGVGSGTPWESGEGSELLLRLLDEGRNCFHHPRLRGLELASKAQVESLGFSVSKERRYARGTGRVFSAYRPLVELAEFSIRSFGRLSVRGVFVRDPAIRRSERSIALGRIEGILGRTLGRGEG